MALAGAFNQPRASDVQWLTEGAVGAPGEGGILGEEVFGHELPWATRTEWLEEAGLWDNDLP